MSYELDDIMNDLTADLRSGAMEESEVTLYGTTVTTVADLESNRVAYQVRQGERDATVHPVAYELFTNMMPRDELFGLFPREWDERRISDALRHRCVVIGTKRDGSPRVAVYMPAAALGQGTFGSEDGDEDRRNVEVHYLFYSAPDTNIGAGILVQRKTTWDEVKYRAVVNAAGKADLDTYQVERFKMEWYGFVPTNRLPWTQDMTVMLLDTMASDYWASLRNPYRDETAPLEDEVESPF